MSSEFEDRMPALDLQAAGAAAAAEHDALSAFRMGGAINGPTIFNPLGPRPDGSEPGSGHGSGSGTLDIPPISTLTDRGPGSANAAAAGEQVAWQYGPAHRPSQRFYLPFYSEIGWVADRVTDALIGKRS